MKSVKLSVICSLLIGLAQAAQAIVLNEIKSNPPGSSDFPYEYIELIGDSGENVRDVYLVVIDGDSASGANVPGTCRLVVNIGATFAPGYTLPSTAEKHLIMVNGNSGHATPAGTTHIVVTAFDTAEQLRDNGAISFLLVRSNTFVANPPAITVGTDYDSNNDGVFDVEPLRRFEVLDAVAWRGGDPDKNYPNNSRDVRIQSREQILNLVSPPAKPDAATRFPGDFTPMCKDAWFGGDFSLSGSANANTLVYSTDANKLTMNFPAGGALTPGSSNAPAVLEAIAAIPPQSGVVNESNPTIPLKLNQANVNTTVTATSSDQTVVPNANITISPATGTARNITVVPIAAGYNIVITLNLNGIATRTFLYSSSLGGGFSTIKFMTGMSDASAAMPISPNLMLVGDDEAPSPINFYSTTASGGPIKSFNFSWFLGLDEDPAHPEADIEGSTRVIGGGFDRIYWIGSLGNAGSDVNDPWTPRPNRDRLFATEVVGTGTGTSLNFAGYNRTLRDNLITWDANNSHAYRFTASAASGSDPKDACGRGFNVEALSCVPGNPSLSYIGFRSPLVPPSPTDGTAPGTLLCPPTTGFRNKALLLRLDNMPQLVAGFPSTTAPTIGAQVQLDLGSRGIRSMEPGTSGYLIVAGKPNSTTGDPKDFAIFSWDGNETTPGVTEWGADLIGHNPESIVAIPSTFAPGSTFQVVEDNGTTDWYNNGMRAKDIGTPCTNNWRKFRTYTVTLGRKASVQYNYSLLADSYGSSQCCGSLSDLPGGQSEGFAINNNDAIVGKSHGFQNAYEVGFIWKQSPNPWSGFNWQQLASNGGQGHDVNETYQAVGWWQNGSLDEGRIWNYGSSPITSTTLATGINVVPRAINDNGRAVGWYLTSSGGIVQPFYWNGSSMVTLGFLPNSFFGQTPNLNIAYGINNRGQIVGSSGVAAGLICASVWEPHPAGGYYAPTNLPTLPGGGNNEAYGINDNGTIVGYAINSAGYRRACAWTRAGSSYQIFDLGVLPTGPAERHSEAMGINNRGQIVGYCTVDVWGTKNAVSWINGSLFNLNSRTTNLENGQSGVAILSTANGINDNGKVTGQVYRSGNIPPCNGTCYKAYILTPIN